MLRIAGIFVSLGGIAVPLIGLMAIMASASADIGGIGVLQANGQLSAQERSSVQCLLHASSVQGARDHTVLASATCSDDESGCDTNRDGTDDECCGEDQICTCRGCYDADSPALPAC